MSSPSIYDYMNRRSEPSQSLEPDIIDAASYQSLDRVKPIIETLKEASEVRIREDKDFQYILDDIERYKEVKKRKTVSLREQDRIDEKEEEKVRNNHVSAKGRPEGFRAEDSPYHHG